MPEPPGWGTVYPPLRYILLFSPLFPSPFYLSLLCFTLLFSSSICLSLPLLSVFSLHSLHHQSCFTAPSLLSPLTVNNFAFVLFFLQSFFSPKNICQGTALPVMGRERGVTGGGVLDKQNGVFIEVRFCLM